MLKSIIFIFALTVVVQARPENYLLDKLHAWGIDKLNTNFENLPKPEDLVFELNEDEYDDYLDFWLTAQYENNRDIPSERAPCSVGVNTLSEPQPVYISGGRLKAPTGNTGILQFSDSETVTAGCAGNNNGLTHSSSTQGPATGSLVCQGTTSFTSPGWLTGQVAFSSVLCRSHSPWMEARTGTCAGGRGAKIDVGVQASGTRYDTLSACFQEQSAEAFYVEYDQTPENAVHQTNVARPSFQQGQWYPGLNVDNLYTQVQQKAAIASVVGQALADVYINSTFFLARGHLAAKSDFVLSAPQRATFTFINAAPQWQPFNGGNWNTLEQNLRARIGNAGYRTKMYTGTWGIMALRDGSGVARDIYLSTADRKIPVPLWYYKVAYEPTTNRGTVYLGLNNPHVTLQEARNLAFCTDVCNGNSQFSWLNWRVDDLRLGYAICCDVNDFRRTVNHLPAFTVNGLLI